MMQGKWLGRVICYPTNNDQLYNKTFSSPTPIPNKLMKMKLMIFRYLRSQFTKIKKTNK